MTRNSPFVLLPLCALLGALAGPAAAQDTGPEPGIRKGPLEPTLSITFRGGSLADYVAVIRNAGDKVNIVLPAEAGKVAVPPLSLLDADVETALEVAAEVADDEYRVSVKSHRSKVGRTVYVIRVLERRQVESTVSGAQRLPDSMVRVFSLCSLTESLPGDPAGVSLTVKPETILTAIDTGLDVARIEGKKPVIRYHKDSGLLFVQGTREQTGIVSDVLGRMENDVERRRKAAQDKARGPATPGGARSGPR